MEMNVSEEGGYLILSKIDQTPAHGARTERPEYTSEIGYYIDSLKDDLWLLNNFIHENPELAFKEYKTHDALTKFMQGRKGWKVTPQAYGIRTAWTAIFETGREGPAISFNAEMGM